MHPSSQQPSSINSLGPAGSSNLLRSSRSVGGVGGAVGPQNFEQNSMMMNSLYEQQQQQQQQLLAAQQSLQGLLSPGSNSSCSSTTQPQSNSVSSNNYPLAMDCDPPLASQQMPPPPPPLQLQQPHAQPVRFGVNPSNLQGGGVSSTTSGSTGSLNSSRIRQNSGGSGVGFNPLPTKYQQNTQLLPSGPASANAMVGGSGLGHHHNYAPASLPLDLVHHPLSAAASHLMMTDSSVITASTAGSSTGPASYSNWPSVAPPNHVFGPPPPPPSHMLAVVSMTNQMDMSNAPAHLQQQHLIQHQQHQLQHSQRRAGGGGGDRLPPGSSNNSSNSSSAGNNSGSGSGDASSPMVGVFVQHSPVVIH